MRNRAALTLVILVTAVIGTSVLGQSSGPQPAPVTNNKLTANTSEARLLLAQAKSAALRIKEGFPRGLVLDEIGAAEAKSGDLDAAVRTANRAYPHTMATVTAIGKALGDSNDLSKAKYLGSQLKGGASSSVFYVIAQRQAEKGRIAEALQTTRLIKAPEVRHSALESIAEQQGASGDYSGARKTFALARAASPGERSTDDVEMMIAALQLSRGDTQGARKSIAAAKSPDERFSMMISGAEALLNMKDRAGATALLEEALQQLPMGPSYDFSRYFAIPTQVKVGKKDAAMQAAGTLPGDLRVKGYMAIAVVCAEAKDIEGVDAALTKIQSTASSLREGEGPSDFVVKLSILNVTAALIDHDQFQAASRWLATIDQQLDDASFQMSIEPNVQLQRVVMFAQQGAFEEARSLALRMRPNSVSEIERGTAIRTIAILDSRKNGVAAVKSWALALTDDEDRAYALLGIAQNLLELGDVKLPYGTISVH